MVNARADRCDREPSRSVLKTESKRACARRALEFPCATHFFFFFFSNLFSRNEMNETDRKQRAGTSRRSTSQGKSVLRR